MSSIPVDKLQKKTKNGFLLALYTQQDIDVKRSEAIGAHRDDHYLFFIMLEGSGSTVVDFEEKIVSANQLYYILPEQIHYRIKTTEAKGWFIAVDPSLVDPECRYVLDSWSGFQKPVPLTPTDRIDYDNLLNTLYSKMTSQAEGTVNLKVLHALLRAFLEMAASTVRVAFDRDAKSSRPAELSRKFKKLLNDNIRTSKTPSHYANMLCISEPYLNECLKKTTGSSVSFWIKYQTIIEAKRLLYFSELNVKQIASDLGFENHSYFSRFFTKETGMTAIAFRKNLRHNSLQTSPLTAGENSDN